MTNTPTNNTPGPDAPWPHTYRSLKFGKTLARYHDFRVAPDKYGQVPCETSSDDGDTWIWWSGEAEHLLNPDEWQSVSPSPPSVEGWYESDWTGGIYYVHDGPDTVGYYFVTRDHRDGTRQHHVFRLGLSSLTRLDNPPAWINQKDTL